MLRIDNLETYGFKSAMKGMRNPMNSWHLNDSTDDKIGNNDLKLLQQLTKAGPDHRKVLRQMMISCDITAPLYWWKEWDTYKVGVTTNSQSTMHKLCSRPLTIHDFSFEDMNDNEFIVSVVLDNLNTRIRDYKEGMKQNKGLWRTIIQLLPSAYNQTRTVTMNYEVIMNIYKQRRHHRLSEWQEWTSFMYNNLPYLSVLLSEANNKNE